MRTPTEGGTPRHPIKRFLIPHKIIFRRAFGEGMVTMEEMCLEAAVEKLGTSVFFVVNFYDHTISCSRFFGMKR